MIERIGIGCLTEGETAVRSSADHGHWLRRADVWLIVAVLLLAGGWLIGRQITADAGAYAVITSDAGEQRVALSETRTLFVKADNGTTVRIEIADGRAWFAHSDCPDGVCLAAGTLSRVGQTAACVPAHVTLRIDGAADDTVDAVAQ